ncbi:chalcone isomerase family protein [soil metagenome]
MKRRLLFAAVLAPLLATGNPSELSDWKPQGNATMRYFGLRIYEARLWAQGIAVNAANWATTPLALELTYARSLSGREIAKRSLVEMRRQVEISAANAEKWLSEMEAAFPDVKEGDRISGVVTDPGSAIQFFINGKPGRKVADAAFARLFIGIWLAPQTSEPALRKALLESAVD